MFKFLFLLLLHFPFVVWRGVFSNNDVNLYSKPPKYWPTHSQDFRSWSKLDWLSESSINLHYSQIFHSVLLSKLQLFQSSDPIRSHWDSLFKSWDLLQMPSWMHWRSPETKIQRKNDTGISYLIIPRLLCQACILGFIIFKLCLLATLLFYSLDYSWQSSQQNLCTLDWIPLQGCPAYVFFKK